MNEAVEVITEEHAEVAEAPKTNLSDVIRASMERQELGEASVDEPEDVDDEGEEATEGESIEQEIDDEDVDDAVDFTPHGDFTEVEKKALISLYKTDPEGAMAINKKTENLLKGFNDKSMTAATLKKQQEGFDAIFGPMDGNLKAQGLTREAVVTNLLRYAQQFDSNPRAAIQQLADEKGIAVVFDDDEDDEERPLTKKDLEALEASRAARQEKDAHSNKQSEYVAKVTAFSEAKDADGKAVRPHLNDTAVFDDFMRLLDRSKMDALEYDENDLQQAYTKAVRLNIKEDVKTESDIEKRQRIAKAKAGSKTVKTTKGKVTPKRPTSIREALDRNWSE